MPEEPQTNPIEQRLRLVLEDKIVGDDSAKHLEKVRKAFTRTQKSFHKYGRQFERHTKLIKAAMPRVDGYAKQQDRLRKAVSASLEPMRKQADLLRKSRREMRSTEKAGRSLSRTLSQLGGLIGVGGLGYLAVSRVQRMMNSRLNLALTGGANQIALLRAYTGGRNTTAAIDLAARFQQQSPYARFGLGDASLRGLVALQRKLEPVGLDLANDLILKVTESLEPGKALQKFLNAATIDPRKALLGAASGTNVQAVTSALNTLQVGELKRDNRLDPMLQAATEFKETGNRLSEAFDKLAETVTADLLPVIQGLAGSMEKIAGVVGNLSTGQLVGGLVGGYAAYRGARWGLGRLIGRGLGRGFPPGVPGVPPRGFYPGGGLNIPGMRPMLPAPSLRTIPRPLTWGMPVTGGVLGYGLPAAAAAGSIYTAGRSAQTAYNERQALKAIQTSMQDRGLFDVASANKSNANTELQRLLAKRQEISAMLLSAPTSDVGERGWLGQKLGFYGDVPQADPKQTEKLRAMYADIQSRIKSLRAVETTGSAGGWMDWIKDGLDKAKDAASKFKTGFDDLVQKGLEANVKRLQQQAARMQQLELTATEQTALTQLSRLDFDIARTTPFGTVGAFGEWRDLQQQLNREIESLVEVAKNIDSSTAQGRIEQARVNAQIKSLRLEERQRSVEMMRGVLDSVQAQAFNAGRFEKIIFTEDRNLRKGLEMGVVKAFSPITGSLNRSGRKPVRLNPATNAPDAVKNLAKAAYDLVPYLEEILSEDESDPNPMRPGASGHSSLN